MVNPVELILAALQDHYADRPARASFTQTAEHQLCPNTPAPAVTEQEPQALQSIWDQLTGWWTPGWGNLFTVAVAIGAIVVSARHNQRTLARAEAQFSQARLDARDDKLRAEVAEFLLALSERGSMDKVYKARLEQLQRSAQPDSQPSPKQLQSLIEETIGGVHNRLAVHSFAIRMLTNDVHITAPAHQIEQAVARELDDIREMAGLGDKAVEPLQAIRLLLTQLTTASMRTDRDTQINGATRLLKNYCLDNMPIERK